MKESINPGGVKSASASPLRALSGAPKCVNDGPINYTYVFPLLYLTSNINNGSVTMLSSPAIGQPLTAKPFGKWVCQITVDIQKTLTSASNLGAPETAMRLSIMEGVGNTTATGDGRIMTSASGGGSWDKGFITNFQGQKFQLAPNSSYDSGLFGNQATGTLGPDLLTMGSFDLASIGKTTITTIFPEQSDECFYRFYPFLFQRIVTSSGTRNAWLASSDNFGNISGWGASGFDRNLYPDFTQIGTITMSFHRLQTVPLFHNSALIPPRTFRFTNDTFYNISIPPTWDWDFGDGSAHSSLLTPPAHTYANPGSYRVRLSTVDFLGAARSFDQVVTIPFKAGFTAVISVFAGSGFTTVRVTDKSLGAVTWDYDWGDGTLHDNNQNATHTYSGGLTTFNVTQKIGDGFGNFDSATVTLVRNLTSNPF